MNTNDILSIVAISLSVLSMIWNVIDYYKFDKPLKKLDIKSREIDILKYQQEQEYKKKAIIKGKFEYLGEGKYYHFHINNIGGCPAKNLAINIPDKMLDLPSPINTIEILPPNEVCSFRVFPKVNCPQSININFTWDDDFGTRRTFTETLFIPNRF